MKKYSSFKKQQILTENFRRFINEGNEENEPLEPLLEGWGDNDTSLGDVAKTAANAIIPGLGTAAARTAGKAFGGAQHHGTNRWDWWEEEEGHYAPEPGMPEEILKLIPHWKEIMKKWKMWPCKEGAARHALQRAELFGGIFGDDSFEASKGVKGAIEYAGLGNQNCNRLVHSAKMYALKLGNDHFDKWKKAKKKEAGDARSQEIGKKRATDREARKDARAAEMGVTREGLGLGQQVQSEGKKIMRKKINIKVESPRKARGNEIEMK